MLLKASYTWKMTQTIILFNRIYSSLMCGFPYGINLPVCYQTRVITALFQSLRSIAMIIIDG
jgi:hypothetical protein